ncbi:MAG: murein biosynthesis integral membrane protein MurJ [Phycisphaeraceae bacterium]
MSTDSLPFDSALPRSSASRWPVRWARLALVLYVLVWLGFSYWPAIRFRLAEPAIVQPDKVVHALAMAGLMALLTAARPLGRRFSVQASALVACLLAAAYAVVDEAAQHWAPTRVVSAADLAANLIGVLGTYVILAAATPLRWRWPTHLARIVWLIAAPSLLYFALAQRGNAMVVDFYRAVGLSLGEADKTAHLLLGAVLTWLLVLAAPLGQRRARANAVLTVGLMLSSAPLLEFAQQLTGRGAEVADVTAHMYGVLIGLSAWALARMARTIVQNPLPSGEGAEQVTRHAHATVNEAGEGMAVDGASDARGETQGDRASPHPGPLPEGEGEYAGERFVGHALRVSALTLVSRLTGLARDAALAAAFGLGVVADAFFIGFLVPNLFRRLFGEGALASAFIPHYTELLRRDPQLARRFASLCLVLLAVVLAGITIVGEVLLAALLAGEWASSTSLAIRLTMVMLPYMPLVCAVALIGGVLQVHGRFGAPAAAPILLNAAMIAAALLAAFGPAPTEEMREVAMWVAVAVVIAGVLQLVWQLAALRGTGGLTLRFAGAGPTLRSMLLMMGPMVAGLAVFQINALMDSLIAFFLSPRDGAAQLRVLGFVWDYPVRSGSVAALQWAQRLYQFPLGVFGIAVATAIFPALSHAAPTVGDRGLSGEGEFARILRQGLRLTMFIALPASVGLILVRLPLATVIYQRGAFTGEDAQRVAWILTGYAASVWAYSMMHVLTRAFYAVKDATTPLRVSVCMVVANLALNLVLIWPLGAAGLAWSTAITGAAQAIVLAVLVGRRVARPVDGEVVRGWLRTAALTAVMAGLVGPMLWALRPWAGTFWGAAGALAAAVVIGAVVMLGGAWVSGAAEVRWLVRRRVG